MHSARSNGEHLLLTESEEFALLTLGMCILHLKSFPFLYPSARLPSSTAKQPQKSLDGDQKSNRDWRQKWSLHIGFLGVSWRTAVLCNFVV
jgi:hypothetical protein